MRVFFHLPDKASPKGAVWHREVAGAAGAVPSCSLGALPSVWWLEVELSATQSLHALAVCRAAVHQASDIFVSADLCAH